MPRSSKNAAPPPRSSKAGWGGAALLEDRVAVALLVEGEVVLKARATAAPDAHAQIGGLDVRALRGDELPHLFGALVGQRDHASQRIAPGNRSWTRCPLPKRSSSASSLPSPAPTPMWRTGPAAATTSGRPCYPPSSPARAASSSTGWSTRCSATRSADPSTPCP